MARGSVDSINKAINIVRRYNANINIHRFNELIDLVDSVRFPDKTSEDYQFVYGDIGRYVNSIRMQMRDNYRIFKDITGGINANFDQFQHRSSDMSRGKDIVKGKESRLQRETPVKSDDRKYESGAIYNKPGFSY